ncbi:putative carbohydrate binding protein [Chthonomonas calidirosea]|uniref:carbohydrate binding domain-containing protein n=1 Tax=Chthonomonas calidirosea TaxID=454171 RepID=UPI0006DD4AD8|nr:carbohydrate binding domain-containing protein [Chthonomonas calidirosea]CEK18165.1 putative carbohydrate binding protein [Chthonomonas calidirosea]
MNRYLRIGILCLTMGLVGLSGVRAQNYVQNGGFETGDFTDWTLSGDTTVATVSSADPHTGNYSAALGTTYGTGYLSQTLSVTPNQSYFLSFWVTTDGSLPNNLDVSFDGNSVASFQNLGPGYQIYEYQVTPTAANPVLQFAFQDTSGYIYLDDVRLGTSSATPEVNSLVGLGFLLALGGVWGVRRARTRTKAITISNSY